MKLYGDENGNHNIYHLDVSAVISSSCIYNILK
jgi:hypothetical protein